MSPIYGEHLHAACCVYWVLSFAFLVDSKKQLQTVLLFKKLMGCSIFEVSVVLLLRGTVEKSWPISHSYDQSDYQ